MASPPASLAASQHLDRPFWFQPPKSPANVTTTPSFATATDYFSPASSKKRPRPNSSHAQDLHHAINTPSWAEYPTPSDRLFESGFGQDSGLINEKYRLAGGSHTPSLQTTARLEQLTVPEYEFRRRLRDDDMGNAIHGDCVPLSGPLARERNGVARMPSSSNEIPRTTWTGLAVSLVGKVFNLGSIVIRGFYAGDGQGYDMNNCGLVGSDLLQEGISNKCSTPIPGAWQDAEFLGDFEQDSPDFGDRSPAVRPSNKRRQTDRDTWVLVGTPDLDTTSSPKRKTSSNNVPRSSMAQRPSASRASSRRSIAPVSRRGNSNIAANGSPAQLSVASPQPLSHGRRASFAPTRSSQGRPSSSGMMYMSPEAERYAKRQAKQDRAADKAIGNMSRQMEEMIRQAQEALGTKVSVEGNLEEDEGFVDDDW